MSREITDKLGKENERVHLALLFAVPVFAFVTFERLK
jgi:hypothetical protein